MLMLLPAGPILALADPNVPAAEGVIISAWRASTLQLLFPDQAVKPDRHHPNRWQLIASRRDLARAVQRQLAALHYGDLDVMTSGDDAYGCITTDVLPCLDVLDWSVATSVAAPEDPTADDNDLSPISS